MKKVELAKYWVCRLDENYGDELKDSAEYKKYYLPLKNYIRDRLGEYQEPTLEQRIELLYKIPQKYFNSNYEEIRDNEFPKLFKVVILVKFHFNQNRKQWFNHPSTHDYYEDIVQHLPTMRNCTYQILDEIPKLDDFVKYYIELKKMVDDYEANSNEWHIRKFNDINKFFKAISPKPLSKYIGLLLEQIKIENQEDSKNTTINVEKDDVLHTDELEESKLICEGATWSITFNNITKTVKDTIGMSIIAHLIKCQGDIIRADKIYYNIVANILYKDDLHNRMYKDDLYVQENVSVESGETEEISNVDKKAITNINNALKKLEKELQVAELEHNIPKINELKTKLQLINSWLSQNADKYGNPRKIIDHIEKARKAIIQSVNTAKRNIKPIHPQFYDHLEKHLKIRKESYYKPNTAIKWIINR